MSWSPKYADRPLRFLFDSEVWAVGLTVLFALAFVINVNFTVSVAVMFAVGAGLQWIVNHHKRGYIIHLLYSMGFVKKFCSYGKYRF